MRAPYGSACHPLTSIIGCSGEFGYWLSIQDPRAGVVYDRTESYAIVFWAITVALIISATLTALLTKPWTKVESSSKGVNSSKGVKQLQRGQVRF